MHFLTWNHFKKDNKKLLSKLGVEKGKPINLRFADGFFICPDDKINRSSSYPVMLLKESIIELFRKKFPKIYDDVKQFYELVDHFDRLDYTRFKMGGKLAFLFAAAYYVHKNKLQITTVHEFYKEGQRNHIIESQQDYLKEFVKLAAQRGQQLTLYSLFPFAVALIRETSPQAAVPDNFTRLTAFVANPGYSPYGVLTGTAFEEYIQEQFEKMEIKKASSLAKLIRKHLNASGVLIPLDEDPDFLRAANQQARGIGLPDYIFVTRAAIIPIDLKVNIVFANPRQVSNDNLRKLFAATDNKIRLIFNGLTIEGRFIEAPKEELKDVKAERKAANPMGVLKKKGVPGRDIGKIYQLWKAGRPVNQELLKKAGVSHANLGMIVKVFNEMLAKK